MKARMIQKGAWVRRQTNEARKGTVTVRNGKTIPVWMAFRCLYCGEYFNQVEAERHFGQTRKDYNKDPHSTTELIRIKVVDTAKRKSK